MAKTNKILTNNYEGVTNVQLDHRTRVTIRALDSFNAYIADDAGQVLEILGPDSGNDRYLQRELPKGSHLVIDTLGKFTMVTIPLPDREEYPDPETMLEIVSEKELSMFDRLKAEMFQALSLYAEQKGLDTFEDDDDYDFVDDENLIDTPYEYEAVREEFLQTLKPDEPASSEPAPTPPVTEAPTPTEQPAI